MPRQTPNSKWKLARQPRGPWVLSSDPPIPDIRSFGGYVQLVVRPASTPAQVFTDGDELAITAAATIVDEDYWYNPVYIPFTVNRQPIVEENEQAIQLSHPAGGHVQFIVKPSINNPKVFADADELAIASTPFFLDEDFWQQPWVTRYFINPQAPGVIGNDSDAWVPFVPPPPVVEPGGGGWKPTIWDPGYKHWPLPPPAFPLEKITPIPDSADAIESKAVPAWLRGIEKKPLTGSQGLIYTQKPVGVPDELQPVKLRISAKAMDQLRNRLEEEEVVYILITQDQL